MEVNELERHYPLLHFEFQSTVLIEGFESTAVNAPVAFDRTLGVRPGSAPQPGFTDRVQTFFRPPIEPGEKLPGEAFHQYHAVERFKAFTFQAGCGEAETEGCSVVLTLTDTTIQLTWSSASISPLS